MRAKPFGPLWQTLPNIQKLEPEQDQSLLSFVGGHDVVALLPTGFGKSLIFQLLQLAPLVVKELAISVNLLYGTGLRYLPVYLRPDMVSVLTQASYESSTAWSPSMEIRNSETN